MEFPDNDFRFDTQPERFVIELRNSENHYNEENFETIIELKALRVSGRVLSSGGRRPHQPVRSTWSLAILSENNWRTSTRDDGEFSLIFWSPPFDLAGLTCA